ncbi:MAG: hypothetical protein GXX85_04860 [Ignavibacteria bacterium]|nr:hypothetical protein [Ignavibacteria bacterium]
MIYKVKISGFENQNVEVKTSIWSAPKLFADGQQAQKGSNKGEMVIQSDDGRQVVAKWKPQSLGLDVPKLIVENQEITLVEPLKWYQLVWSGLPITLIFVGGLLGALLGFIGLTINSKMFRSEMNNILKYVVTGAISLGAVMIFFIFAFIFTGLVENIN